MGLRWLIKPGLQSQPQSFCRMVSHTTSAPLRFQEIKAGEVQECRNSITVPVADLLLPGTHHPGDAQDTTRTCRDADTPGNSSSLTGTERCTLITATSASRAGGAAEGGLCSCPSFKVTFKQHTCWQSPLSAWSRWVWVDAAPACSSPAKRVLLGTARGGVAAERLLRGRVPPSPNICADVNRHGRARFSI